MYVPKAKDPIVCTFTGHSSQSLIAPNEDNEHRQKLESERERERMTPSLATCRLLVPPLTSSAYKGQAGKIGVIGGCVEYTGAPFYAAISALKLGADLSHVFCDEQAAGPIKGYSPEIIVHGCMRGGGTKPDDAETRRQADEICKWFPALSALVVGPGLGRDPTLQAVAALVVERAVSVAMPCVIDADGLRLVLDRPEIVRGSPWTVLTPNNPEYLRLTEALLTEDKMRIESVDDAQELLKLARLLGGPTIVRKGPRDLISDGTCVAENGEPGSLKRSGGQGDVLAGTIATLLSWAKAASPCLPSGCPPAPVLAAYTGCLLTRRFSAAAFNMCSPNSNPAPRAKFERAPSKLTAAEGCVAWSILFHPSQASASDDGTRPY